MRNIIILAAVLFMSCTICAEEKAVNDPQFHKTLLEIAASYERFGRVDDEARWAPWLCKMPSPSMPRESKSSDESTHGRKLYFIFSSQPGEYRKLTKTPKSNAFISPLYDEIQPKSATAKKDRDDFTAQLHQRMAEPSQELLQRMVAVKESWTPKEVTDGEVWGVQKNGKPSAADIAALGEKDAYIADRVSPFSQKDGKWFRADQRGPLFIMYKTDKAGPETDEGWVYGTVSTDGKTVTSAGRVASCMKCHTEAPHGRMFGLPPVEVKKKGD